jgi:hypothetical protein
MRIPYDRRRDYTPTDLPCERMATSLSITTLAPHTG